MAKFSHLGHFPFCLGSREKLSEQSFSQLSFYPIDMSLDQVMAMFYKVKRWRLNSYEGITDIDARDFYEFSNDPPPDGTGLYYTLAGDNERALICPSFLNGEIAFGEASLFDGSYYATSTDFATPENVDSTEIFMFGDQIMFFPTNESNLTKSAILNRTPIIYSSDNKYWPYFNYFGVTPPSDPESEDPESTRISFGTVGDGAVVGIITLNFSEFTFEIPVYTEAEDSETIDFVQQYASASISEIESWEFQ